jgi:hypothetical protein
VLPLGTASIDRVLTPGGSESMTLSFDVADTIYVMYFKPE